jgi:hypothetical protein
LLSTRLTGLALFLALFVIYNANGREIGGSDSQPTKLGARSLVLRGNLRLDEDVRRIPQLAERVSFAKDRNGHFRSAYSPIGSIFGAVTAALMRIVGADLDAPRGPNLIAKLTASLLTAGAVWLVYVTLLRFSSPGVAFAVALGLGIGTNFWALHSQTMAQHDVVAFGFALCLFAWTRPTRDIAARHLWLGAIGLALAVTARTQTAPLAGLLGMGLMVRVGWRRSLVPLAFSVLCLAVLMVAQWRWFGHPLGAMPLLEQLHPDVHAVTGSLSREPWIGAAGLLVSPNRGLLFFSPVVVIALLGIVPGLRAFPDHGLGWALAGCLVLFAGYASYTVWWGGHSYGPRYLLDFVLFLTPAAAVALERVLRRPVLRGVCVVLLAWSIVAAGTGAFCADDWNTRPSEVDKNHWRLWDWRDLQVKRAWEMGLSPQNFNLFNWTSYRTSGPPDVR